MKTEFYAGPYDGFQIRFEPHQIPGKGDTAVGSSCDNRYEHVYIWCMTSNRFIYSGVYKRGACVKNVILRLGYKVRGKSCDLHEGGYIEVS